MAQDIDCKSCKHYKDCKEPCIYVDRLANGNIARKEPLIGNIIGNADISSDRDYEAILSDLGQDRAARIEYALQIQDYRLRSIAAMLLSDITRNEICSLLMMSYRQLSRLINNNTQLRAIRAVKMSQSDYNI
jgi:hypothetical protein